MTLCAPKIQNSVHFQNLVSPESSIFCYSGCFHCILHKILHNIGPMIQQSFLQCLYSVKVHEIFLNDRIMFYQIIHRSFRDMLCITFRAIKHTWTWSAYAVCPNMGSPARALPGLIFALTFHLSPFLKFLECGECDETMRSCSASWLLSQPFVLFNKVPILYQLLSNKFSCPNSINFRHSTK